MLEIESVKDGIRRTVRLTSLATRMLDFDVRGRPKMP
jgi:hypothetical protein